MIFTSNYAPPCLKSDHIGIETEILEEDIERLDKGLKSDHIGIETKFSASFFLSSLFSLKSDHIGIETYWRMIV